MFFHFVVELFQSRRNTQMAEKPKKKMYHVAKRESDGMWTVKFAGGEKVIKTFKTKAEALEYADKLAEKQDGVVLAHASKGKSAGKIQKRSKA